MSVDQRVLDLVLRYEELASQGQPLTPEELCRDCPELLDELRRRLASLGAINPLLDTEPNAPASSPGSPAAGPAEAVPPADGPSNPDLPGLVGRYQVQGEIARGGMGAVYRVHDPDCNRTLALKVLLPQHQGASARARFHEEAQLTAQLQHPGVPPVHEIGQLPDGRPFFVMKLVKGRTLADLLNDRTDPSKDLPRYLGMFSQVCQTLAYVHSRGIIHRDLKPSNIMVGAFGEVQVMDWGLAKVLASRERERPEAEPASTIYTVRTATPGLSSQAGTVLGTPAYMPPEQALGQVELLDERADVFGLGAILCVILIGRAPYQALTRWEVHRQAAGGDLGEALERLEKCGADAELVELAKSCLARKFEDRPRHAAEVAQAWAGYQERVEKRLRAAELARTAAQVKAAEERKRRRQLVALGVPLVLAMFAGLGTWWWLAQARAERQAVTARDVNAALVEAELLLEQARAETGDNLRQWAAALAASQRAEGRMAGEDIDDNLRSRVRNLIADLQAEEKARHMVAELEDIRLRRADVKEGHFDWERADKDYALAFRKLGIDIERLPIGEAVDRIRASRIRVQLAAGLHDWAQMQSWMTNSSAGWKRLLAIAQRVDPDPWRSQLRAALMSDDKRGLHKLTKTANDSVLPGSTLVLLAHALFTSGDRSGAVEFLRKVQRRHAGDFWINHQLAQYLQHLDPPHLEEAIRFYTAALSLRNRSPGAHLNIAGALLDKGQVDEAIAAYTQAIQLKEDYTEAHIGLGKALLEKGRLKEAITACKHALRLNKDHPWAHITLGNVFFQKGQLDSAIAAYKETIRLKKDYPEAHRNLGLALDKKGLLDAAIAAFKQAIRIKRNYTEAHVDLGNALWKKGQLDAALAAHKEAVRLNKNSPWAHHCLGLTLDQKGRLEEAIVAHREAIRLKGDYPESHAGLGNALRQKGQLAEAIAAYTEALHLKPDYAEAHEGLGMCLYQVGRLDPAIAAFKQAIRIKHDYAKAYNDLGCAQFNRGLVDEALAALREAIRLKQNDPYAHSNLGNALVAKNRLVEAVAAFKEAIRLKKDFADAYCNLSVAFSNLGRLDEGIAACQEAIRLKKDYAEAYCNLGLLLQRQGEFTKALAALKRGHEFGSRNPNWRYPSGKWLTACEHQLTLDAQLPAILRGTRKPRDANEAIEFAEFGVVKRLYRSSAQWYYRAFASKPALAEDLEASYRYDAACAAALAAAGRGEEAAKLAETDRARLRQQALTWLRADLVLLEKLLQTGKSADRTLAQSKLKHWQGNLDLAAIRNAAWIANLPDEELRACRKLWADVAALLARAEK
jgi:serine/threonine-protein kinase